MIDNARYGLDRDTREFGNVFNRGFGHDKGNSNDNSVSGTAPSASSHPRSS